MKTLHFLLIGIFSLSFGVATHEAFADNSDKVEITSVGVSPSTIKVGDTFRVTATLVNNSTVPIWLHGGKCSTMDKEAQFITVTFDNHATVKPKDIFCAGEGYGQKIDPGRNITTTSPDYTASYVATEAGTANATVTFSYQMINQTDPTQRGLSGTISKSIQFTVSDQTSQPLYCCGNTVTIILDSPLKQFKSGIAAKDITCKDDLILVIKAEDDFPACVTPSTAQKLTERGWAKSHNGIDALGYPPIRLYNVTTSIHPIILGMSFYVNAEVANYQNSPITYYGGCVSPLSVTFDNIKTNTDSIHCLAISKYVLGPNEHVTVHTDKIDTIYNGTGPNSTIANVKFTYENDGSKVSWFTSAQFPIQSAVKLNCTVPFGIQMAQITNSVNVQKAIALAYTSSEFLTKVKQYGTVSYSSFYLNLFPDESCNAYWKSVEVMFTTNDKNGSRNIQVSEDINLTKVLSVSDFQVVPTK